MSETLIIILLIVSSFTLTSFIRHIALKRMWLDTPNARSSHLVPTPKSGGLAFVVTFTAALVYLYAYAYLSFSQLAVLLTPVIVAASGMLDDFRSLSVVSRIGIQMLAALTVMFLVGGLPQLPVFGYLLDFGWIGYVIGVLGLVWLMNLFNFMDGIDGIAALEAGFVCLAVYVLLVLQGGYETAFVLMCMLAAIIGFLLLNFPPARIFMGDVGSQYLGLMMGVLGLVTIEAGYMHIWSWAILLGVFIVDSTMTLVRRLRNGQMWYHAHRTHAYQHAAISLGSHAKVDLGITLINICWLFPLAWISLLLTPWAMLLTCAAYSPLIWLSVVYRAGVEQE